MDIYNIPGDTGGYWRIDKLIECKDKVNYVDVTILSGYVKRLKNISNDDLVLLAWYFSLTYSETTAFWLKDNLDFYSLTKSKLEKFWIQNKQIMQFSSSRRYCKNMDWFVPLMEKFVKTTKKEPYSWFCYILKNAKTPEEKYRKVFNELNKWKYMGRFSSEIFLWAIEAFYEAGKFIEVRAYEPPFSWKNGSNVTSGMLNLIYEDEPANEFDKTGHLSDETLIKLDKGLAKLNERCESKGFKQDSYTSILPRICSFRNLFKCNRYIGYHHDRQLEQLLAYKDTDTDTTSIDRIFKLRKTLYPKYLLGELNGWTGIRPERKKLFIEKGVLGIEDIDN